MSDKDQQAAPALDSEMRITLGLLNVLESNSGATQRSVASELGIALGLANAYLKRCAKKGYIKVSQAPRKRYAYYLTPTGFAEKSRLTAAYLSQSFTFFRRARTECSDLFALCASQGWRRIGLAGRSDLAEIATLCAHDFPVELIGIVDRTQPPQSFAGLAVVPSLEGLGAIDAVIITELLQPQSTFDWLARHLPPARVLAPQFMHISRASSAAAASDLGDGS